MKRVVVATGLHEADIRPPALLSEFKRLSVIDAGTYFGDPEKLVEVDCPACGCSNHHGVFHKNEFLYNTCQDCQSLYVSPRPTNDALADYYANSDASRYRVEHFARETAEARRTHLLRSHASWFARMVDEVGNPEARSYADAGTQSIHIFDAIKSLNLFDKLYSLNPLASLDDECAARGVNVARDGLQGLGGITALGQLENRFSPIDYLGYLGAMLADKGILTFTTRTVSGLDMQILWDKTPYIFVPEHMNLLSVEGITRLIERSGLELIELSTPGQLDLEMILHAAENDPSIKIPSFIQYMLDHRGEETLHDFQVFLQKHRLSSHVRVAVAKRSAASANADSSK